MFWLLSAALLLWFPLLGSLAAADPRQPFYGVWRLVRYELKDKATGKVKLPYTDKPEGRITYDQQGRMSAQLMRPGRKPLSGRIPQAGAANIIENAAAEEVRDAAIGFIAYYGTFDVLPGERTVVHHVKASLLPNWVGTDLRRQYEFKGHTLTLMADTPAYVGILVWERE
ncbi:MAG: lipocalin-like domain-containing protein [Bryobacterales bacterium]|nr:lipocalin-like domain-containing protein [Bryobacterales bacterium]